MEYSVEKSLDGKWHVVGADGISLASYGRRDNAQARADEWNGKKRPHGWVYVWQSGGVPVSKMKVFASRLNEWDLVRRRINRQLVRPVDYPHAQARVLGRVRLCES